jgi:hypothetical protein
MIDLRDGNVAFVTASGLAEDAGVATCCVDATVSSLESPGDVPAPGIISRSEHRATAVADGRICERTAGVTMTTEEDGLVAEGPSHCFGVELASAMIELRDGTAADMLPLVSTLLGASAPLLGSEGGVWSGPVVAS